MDLMKKFKSSTSLLFVFSSYKLQMSDFIDSVCIWSLNFNTSCYFNSDIQFYTAIRFSLSNLQNTIVSQSSCLDIPGLTYPHFNVQTLISNEFPNNSLSAGAKLGCFPSEFYHAWKYCGNLVSVNFGINQRFFVNISVGNVNWMTDIPLR